MEIIVLTITILMPIANVLFYMAEVQRFVNKWHDNCLPHKLYDIGGKRSSLVLKPADMQKSVRKNNVAEPIGSEFVKSYKRVYYSFYIYVALIILSIVLCVTCVFLPIRSGNKEHAESYIACIFVAVVLIWIFEVSPLLKYFGGKGVRKIADAIDYFFVECISSNGKIYTILAKKVKRGIILIFNLILFVKYVTISMCVLNLLDIEKDLLILFVMLCLYQYGLIHIFAWVLYKVYYWRKSKKRESLNLNSNYLYAMLKNSTYLLFWIFYLFTKYMQIDSPFPNFGIELAEAISLLYLIDTYFAQCNACEALKDSENGENR